MMDDAVDRLWRDANDTYYNKFGQSIPSTEHVYFDVLGWDGESKLTEEQGRKLIAAVDKLEAPWPNDGDDLIIF